MPTKTRASREAAASRAFGTAKRSLDKIVKNTNPMANVIRGAQQSWLGMTIGNLLKPSGDDKSFAHLRRPEKKMHPMRSGTHRKKTP